MDWPTFRSQIRWRQGEHVSLIGPTGYGKTTTALSLLELRDYVVILATKPRDAVLDRLVRSGQYSRIESWPPPMEPSLMPRVILWPRWKGQADTGKMADTFWEALGGIFAEGRWAVYADELAYICRRLGLANDLQDFWQQGRSLKLSMLGATQRPAHVPLDLYTEAQHLFLFRQVEANDLKRVQGLAGIDPAGIRDRVRRLGKYEFLYIDKTTERLVLSQSPR